MHVDNAVKYIIINVSVLYVLEKINLKCLALAWMEYYFFDIVTNLLYVI